MKMAPSQPTVHTGIGEKNCYRRDSAGLREESDKYLRGAGGAAIEMFFTLM